MDELPGPGGTRGGPSLDSLLGSAVRADADAALDTDAQRQALAAFRAARDEGAHRARTRRRDDWRPRGRRKARVA
ncbi:hypothetical protein [Streptomyces kanamyceticus]|uniref:Uncharacterized protein n=1 Tax=Streptomyces kanamyceticus TaxID=1967 RepID=A0A5J6GEI7_STRKN|nr:hypothetical protein [Streptomyces kanamyceticus]QEU92275.1 hypothetical protein CP970_16375 [Streptomyces kanamyceticus]